MVSKKAIIKVVLIVVSVATFLSLSFQPQINEVYIGVMYDGEWQGTIGDNAGASSWGATGDYVRLLERPLQRTVRGRPKVWFNHTKAVSKWFVSAYAQKMDDSAKEITIMIFLEDETILAEESTSSPYGMVQTHCEVKRP